MYPWHQAAAFFDACTGFVEIIREERLERVFFVIPDNCLRGGPLFRQDFTPAMIKDCDFSDADSKNLQCLPNPESRTLGFLDVKSETFRDDKPSRVVQ